MTPSAAALVHEAHVWVFSLDEDVRVGGPAACRAAARGVLDRIVAVYAPEASVIHRAGRRPDVQGAPLHVSLAHTATLAVAAITRTVEVGVDVEPAREPPPDAVLGQLLTDDEVAMLRALPPSARGRAFVQAWVRKEAVLKAVGIGLSLDPRLVEVVGDGSPEQLVTLPGGRAATVVELVITGHQAAVAFAGDTAPTLRVNGTAHAPVRASRAPAGLAVR